MKRLYLSKFAIVLFVALAGSVATFGQALTYSQSFTSGSSPSSQCTAWDAFRASLLSSYQYRTMIISGTNNTTGITCTNPTVVAALANALRTNGTYTGSSDGFNWGVFSSGCGSGCGNGTVELNTVGSACACATGYTIRPNIGNANWGCINGSSCGAGSQTMTVIFVTGPPTPTIVGPRVYCSGDVITATATSTASSPVFTWTGPSGFTFTGSSISVPATLATAGVYSCIVTSGGSSSFAALDTVVVNPTPSFNIGTYPAACRGAATANLVFSGMFGNPNTFDLVYDATAHAAGFVDVFGGSMTASPLVLGVPTAAPAAVYSGTLTLNTPFCFSQPYPITVTVNPIPTMTMAGSPGTCYGTSSANLNYSATSGSPNRYSINYGLSALAVGFTNISNATLGASPVVLPVPAGAVAGTYTNTLTLTTAAGCNSVPIPSSVTVFPLAPVTGTSNICVGSVVTMGNAIPGGSWSSSFSGTASVDPTAGIVTGVAQGLANITYTTAQGCVSLIGVSIAPAVQTIYGTTAICAGSGTTLNDNDFGGTWSSGNPSVAIVSSSPSSGIINGVNAGTAIITYAVSAGCRDIVTLTVNPLPAAITGPVPGPLNICMGSTSTFNDATPGGNWSSNDPTLVTIDYTTGVANGIASGLTSLTYTSIEGCSTVSPISINDLPVPYTVTAPNGGNYCPHDPGVRISLANSNAGINYQLFRGASTTPLSTVAGSNASIDFSPAQTITGTYKVIATNALTGCSIDMSNTITVGISPLPDPKAVLGGGAYCAGGSGDSISMATSDINVNYQLFNGTLPVGVAQAGTGGAGPSFGLLTAAGTYTVMATDLTTNCHIPMLNSVNVSISPLPRIFNVTGGGSYCAGGNGVFDSLSGSENNVKYFLHFNNGAAIDSVAGNGLPRYFTHLQTGTGTYTVDARSNAGCWSTMTGSATISINPLPDPYTVIADNNGHYCTGSSAPHIDLSFSALGIHYQLYRSTNIPVGTSVAGLSSGLDLGAQSIPGVYTIVATNDVTGCSNAMSNSITVIRDVLPTIYPVSVTGGGSYCAGGNGQRIRLNGSQIGVNYDLDLAGTPAGSMSGSGTTLDFGLFTNTGSYTILATDVTSGCSNPMSGSALISINPLPDAYPVSGGGGYCAGGTGLPITLGSSRTGINYQLMNNNVPVGSAVPGSGGSLNFGLKTAAGMYTIVATNRATLCSSQMNGDAIIAVNPPPSLYYITGGGTFCTGGSGVHVGLSGGDLGISYQLFRGATPVGISTPGNGSSIDFGLQAGAGSYTIVGTDDASHCTNNMVGSVSVSTIAPPAVYAVTGGGHYCDGTPAPHIRLSGSNAGINYQLMNNSQPVGSVVPGTNLGIDFGAQAADGNYTIMATTGTSHCNLAMSGTPSVTTDPSPVIYAVSGGGSSCSAGPGVMVGLTASDFGNNYQLYNGSTLVGLPIGGTSSALSFGLQTAPGSYTIVGTNTTNGCTNTMQGNAPVTIIPSVTPAVNITSSGGDTICVGSLTSFTAAAVNGGSTPSFQWSINGAPVYTGTTYSYVPADGDNVTATVTSNATCVTAPTASNHLTTHVILYRMPSATIIADPSDAICAGTPVTFNVASVTNGGSSPVYSWVNGTIVGTGLSYSDGSLGGGEVITFMLNSNLLCHSADTVFSNTFHMDVDAHLVFAVNVTDHMSDDIIVGHVDTLFATVSPQPSGPISYQWYVNGNVIPGAIQRIYVNHNIFDGDIMRCDVTASNNCGPTTISGSQTVQLDLRNTGVGTLSASNISVVPNPSKGEFTVKGTLGTTEDTETGIEVTNMLGQVVYRTTATAHNGTIEEHLSLNVASGMYLLNIHAGGAGKVFHIVVEK